MPKTSKSTAPDVEHRGPSEARTDELDGYTVNFVTITEAMDLSLLLKGLPGDSCPCPHWGHLLKGRLTVRYADREEVIEAGDAFYLPPGHVPAAEAGTEFVQFSPRAELEVVTAAMTANAQRMQGGSLLAPAGEAEPRTSG